MTRTKNEVVLLIPSDASLFTEELLTDNNYLLAKKDENLQAASCPYLKTGKLVTRQNQNARVKFRDANIILTAIRPLRTWILDDQFLCYRCESGFMAERAGTYSNFLGCTNYPGYRNTINLN